MRTQLYINGEWRDSENSAEFTVWNPTSGSELASVASGTSGDATAAVDAATERQIREALAEITAERATLIIAHRLSSLMHADEILFLDHGHIVERGSHSELVAQGGRYAELYLLQTQATEADLSASRGMMS